MDLAESHDPHLLIPGDPVTLLAAARALLHNADLHDTLAIRQRRLHDGDWSGAAADAFHAHLTVRMCVSPAAGRSDPPPD